MRSECNSSSARRPGPEAFFHPLELGEKLDRVSHHLPAGDLGDRPQHQLGADLERPQARSGRGHQQPKDPVVEQTSQVLGRLHEVEGVLSRRGVHHDQVEVAAFLQLVQLLDRHVLLGPG